MYIKCTIRVLYQCTIIFAYICTNCCVIRCLSSDSCAHSFRKTYIFGKVLNL